MSVSCLSVKFPAFARLRILILRKKKDGGGTFDHNTLRT